ncbi:MAG: hypothetical protein COT35_12455 [Nitrospirae bacterium CG08_land_8_20_14_0_20_52_24]|nr:MAG: hypothetical protein AUK29_08520 [Nitrospirae bacterium CG2_30_53_67]PIS36206.1 MAG: hypothetical protein COT35_12455 [Nitrospirae bacterium CG08_land_8_20_14_0_20_52_24]PIW84761.1 MAG: hypothetical protein COZ95_08140 [Nitrospirae bacterium CG_4_8_14_3_um_filter_50_41]PIX84898.1 MAG: hypothetical protein COZ32_11335 [Nitrospirae bacterium CG_4_10_14_3_um_filter_53_41]
MNESLVQWTLLNNLDYLSDALNFKIAVKRGEQVSTDFGRIDFILEDIKRNQLIVELETLLEEKAKIDYCFDQVLNYKNVNFVKNTEYCMIYAIEAEKNIRQKIDSFGLANDVLVRTYSLNEVKNLYTSTVDRLSLSFGLALPKPSNYTICYLRWLNKILKPFYDYSKEILNSKELAKYFTSPQTTNFRCYLRLALDFEMIEARNDLIVLTQNGKDYIANFNPDIDLASNLWCMELGLVDRIKSSLSYDRVFLTPLGIEINNIFSLDLQIKKSKLNLNFKYLE